MIRRLADGWINHPAVDLPIVLVAVAAAVAVDPDAALRSSERGSWYQTLATVNGVLLSVGVIAITLVFTVTPSDRLTRVYRAVGPALERLVMSCLGALVVTTAGFAALYLTNSASHEARVGLTTALVALSALRFGRLWWLLRRILQALMSGLAEPPRGDEEWTRPSMGPGDYAVPTRRLTGKAKD
jgi:hypothetical protein